MDLRSLAFDSTTHQAVLSHLRAAPERVAFMSTTAETAEVVDWVPMTDRDVIVGPSCAELTDEATARFFTWAARGEGAIIEAHSHLGRWGDPARFSDLDLDTLQEWVPHVRWRLGWRPYVALVVGPTTVDGLYWNDGRTAKAASSSLLWCRASRCPYPQRFPCHTEVPAVTEKRYSRHEGLFGVDGQILIEHTRIGMVGIGGLGMQVAQQLAYAGVRDYHAVEFDVVSESSLNRLVGALPSDVGRAKLEVFLRLVESVQPGAKVKVVEEEFDAGSASVTSLLRDVDVLFSCVDNERSRVAVLAFASSHGIPLIDTATDIGFHPDGRPWYGGRVVVAQGDGCPLCLDVIDQRELAVAYMNDEQLQEHARIYGIPLEALNRPAHPWCRSTESLLLLP